MGDLVFDFKIETKPTGQTAFRVKRAQFGEGYAQKVGDGLNNKFSTWNVAVDNDYAYVLTAKQFLDQHGGWQSFLWTPPNYTQPIRVTCETYSEISHVGEQCRLTAVFEQVYFP